MTAASGSAHSPVRPMQITVIGDSEADEAKYRFAEELGKRLAEEGCTVITGGRGGVMEAVNKGAAQAGGISVGILPSNQLTDANKYCSIVIPTGVGHARNVFTALAADAIVTIGGGAGTLTEISFGWIHHKPIFAFPQFEGWSGKIAGAPMDDKYDGRVTPVGSIDDLISEIRKLGLSDKP